MRVDEVQVDEVQGTVPGTHSLRPGVGHHQVVVGEDVVWVDVLLDGAHGPEAHLAHRPLQPTLATLPNWEREKCFI